MLGMIVALLSGIFIQLNLMHRDKEYILIQMEFAKPLLILRLVFLQYSLRATGQN
jgi:hypothetical protein